MPEDTRPDVDRRLRDVFDADPAVTARIVAGALAPSTRPPRLRGIGLAAGAAGVCVAAALALWPSPPTTEPEPPPAPFLSGSLTEGLLVVPLPDGSIAVTGGEARQGRPDDGYGIVLVEGELR